MKLKIFILITITVLLNSCGYGDYGKYSSDLDNISANVIDVSDEIDSIIVKYHSKNSIDTVILYDNWIVIKGYVEQVNINENFILVKQKPIDSICACVHDCYKNFDLYGFQNCHDEFKKYDKYLYWVIIVKTDDIYVPLEKQDYLELCENLNVPNELVNKKKNFRDRTFDNINSKP